MFIPVLLLFLGYSVLFSGITTIRNPEHGWNLWKTMGFTGSLTASPDRLTSLVSTTGIQTPSGGVSINQYTPQSGIYADAIQYKGVPYRWGAANPKGWDCSGFVNWVLGHDLGMTLPGGIKNFSGNWHGPVTGQYFTWSGAVTVPRSDCRAGDLCCWLGHIGIAVSNTHMINAYTAGKPTAVTPINGWAPGPLRIRRVKAQTNIPGAALIQHKGLGA